MNVGFFCVANDRHFLGAVALLNSLREVGHEEPFYLVDCGLTDRQRRLVSGQATLIPGPRDLPPTMVKAHGPLQVDAEVSIVLDADIIVLRPLTDLVGPKPVLFLNDWTWRFEPDWANLGYGPPTRIPYLNAGQMIVPRASGLLPRLQRGYECLSEILRANPRLGLRPEDPFYYTDQDVLNALVASLEPDQYLVSDEVTYWPFSEPLGEARMLHHILAKPWLEQLRPSPYSREMSRLLASGRVRIPSEMVPARLRGGTVGSVSRTWASARHTVRDHTRGKLGLRRRLAERSALRAGRSPI